ncbi:MAG: TauD/TfdA family dioxygenase, partial [Elainellaceae cyanobacterium]
MNARPLFPFGAELAGLDSTAITPDAAAAIRYALADHGVAVVRNQQISDADFSAFLTQLGPLTFTVGERPVADQPLLNVVSNVGRSRPPRSVFHTDTSYV